MPAPVADPLMQEAAGGHGGAAEAADALPVNVVPPQPSSSVRYAKGFENALHSGGLLTKLTCPENALTESKSGLSVTFELQQLHLSARVQARSHWKLSV